MIEMYRPLFTHKDWIDNQDRVQAGGEDGLNYRFHQLENEFARLADNQINPMLATLGTSTRHLTLTPALMSYNESSGAEVPPWSQIIDMVEKPDNRREAHGFMNVVLPDGAIVQSLLATGINESTKGTLEVGLVARAINEAGGGAIDPLIRSTVLNTPAEPKGEVRISNDAFRYYLTVDVDDADEAASVKVFCVRLAYQ